MAHVAMAPAQAEGALLLVNIALVFLVKGAPLPIAISCVVEGLAEQAVLLVVLGALLGLLRWRQ